MTDSKPRPDELVMTQAELPPGIDVPGPRLARDLPTEGAGPSADLLRDVKELAERAGGLDRLRELVDLLADMPR